MFFTFNMAKQSVQLPQCFHLQGIILPSWSMQQDSKIYICIKIRSLVSMEVSENYSH